MTYVGDGLAENMRGVSINPGGKPKSSGFYFIKLLRTYSAMNLNHRFPSYIPQSPFFIITRKPQQNVKMLDPTSFKEKFLNTTHWWSINSSDRKSLVSH